MPFPPNKHPLYNRLFRWFTTSTVCTSFFLHLIISAHTNLLNPQIKFLSIITIYLSSFHSGFSIGESRFLYTRSSTTSHTHRFDDARAFCKQVIADLYKMWNMHLSRRGDPWAISQLKPVNTGTAWIRSICVFSVSDGW